MTTQTNRNNEHTRASLHNRNDQAATPGQESRTPAIQRTHATTGTPTLCAPRKQNQVRGNDAAHQYRHCGVRRHHDRHENIKAHTHLFRWEKEKIDAQGKRHNFC